MTDLCVSKRVVTGSFYGAASYVANDVRNKIQGRAGLTHGYYGEQTHAGDWKIDFEANTLRLNLSGYFNRRESKMQGAYPEYYNEVHSQLLELPLDRVDDLRDLTKYGYKITPHLEFIMQQCKDFRDGKLAKENLGKQPLTVNQIAELLF